MTNAIQTGRLARLWCFISSVCKAWRCWWSQKSSLREDTKCRGDLRSGCLGTLFHCFARPAYDTRNSLLTAHPLQSYVRSATDSMQTHLQETATFLSGLFICTEVNTEQNSICARENEDKLRDIYKLIKHWMLETRTAFTLSLLILHVKISRTKGTTEKKFWSMMGPHFSNCHIVKAKLFNAQVSNTILCPAIHKGKIMLPSI